MKFGPQVRLLIDLFFHKDSALRCLEHAGSVI